MNPAIYVPIAIAVSAALAVVLLAVPADSLWIHALAWMIFSGWVYGMKPEKWNVPITLGKYLTVLFGAATAISLLATYNIMSKTSYWVLTFLLAVFIWIFRPPTKHRKSVSG